MKTKLLLIGLLFQSNFKGNVPTIHLYLENSNRPVDNYRNEYLKLLREKNKLDAERFDVENINYLFDNTVSIITTESNLNYDDLILKPKEAYQSATQLIERDKKKFVDFKASDWKLYFGVNEQNIKAVYESQAEICFRNYILYQYPEYIEFLKQFNSYDQRIIKLQNDIQRNDNLKSYLSKIKNFDFKAIENECCNIQLKYATERAKKNESDWHNTIQKENELRSFSKERLIDKWENQLKQNPPAKYLQDRIDAASKNDTYLQTYSLDPLTASMLHKYGIDTTSLTNYQGNALDHQFIKEAIELADKAALNNSKFQDPYSETTLYLVGAVIQVSKKDFEELTSQILDVGHAIGAFINGVIRAAGDNIETVKYIFKHPLEAVQNFKTGLGKLYLNVTTSIVNLFTHPKKLYEKSKKLFVDFYDKTYKIYKNTSTKELSGKTSYYITNLLIKKFIFNQSIFATKKIKKSIKKLIKTEIGQQATSVIEKLKNHSIDRLDLFRNLYKL